MLGSPLGVVRTLAATMPLVTRRASLAASSQQLEVGFGDPQIATFFEGRQAASQHELADARRTDGRGQAFASLAGGQQSGAVGLRAAHAG